MVGFKKISERMSAMNKKEKLSFLKNKKMLAISAVLVSVFIIAFLALRPKAYKVESYRVEKGLVEDVYTGEGLVKEGEKLHIMARVSGAVEEIAVSENMLVQKGDLLLKIDKRDLLYQKELRENSLASLKAKKEESEISRLMSVSPSEYLGSLNQTVSSAEAAYAAASSEYQAKQELSASGALPSIELEAANASFAAAKEAYEEAKARRNESRKYFEELKKEGLSEADINERFYASINAQLDAAIGSEESALEQIEEQMQDCEIRAKEGGMVISLPAKDFSMVSAGQELAVLSQSSDHTEVECEVLTGIASYLKIGDRAKISFKRRGDDKVYEAKIKEIYEFANEGKSAIGMKEYRVKIILELDGEEKPDLMIKDGYGVDVDFVLYRKEDAISVPVSAVFRFEDRDYLFKIVAGRAVKSPIKIEYKSAVSAVIAEGLQEGEEVILNADEEALVDGIAVRR